MPLDLNIQFGVLQLVATRPQPLPSLKIGDPFPATWDEDMDAPKLASAITLMDDGNILVLHLMDRPRTDEILAFEQGSLQWGIIAHKGSVFPPGLLMASWLVNKDQKVWARQELPFFAPVARSHHPDTLKSWLSGHPPQACLMVMVNSQDFRVAGVRKPVLPAAFCQAISRIWHAQLQSTTTAETYLREFRSLTGFFSLDELWDRATHYQN